MKIFYSIGIAACFALALYAIKTIYIIGNAFIDGNVHDSDVTYFIIKFLLYIAGLAYISNTIIKLFREIKNPKTSEKT